MAYRVELKSPVSGDIYVVEDSSTAARLIASGYVEVPPASNMKEYVPAVFSESAEKPRRARRSSSGDDTSEPSQPSESSDSGE